MKFLIVMAALVLSANAHAVNLGVIETKCDVVKIGWSDSDETLVQSVSYTKDEIDAHQGRVAGVTLKGSAGDDYEVKFKNWNGRLGIMSHPKVSSGTGSALLGTMVIGTFVEQAFQLKADAYKLRCYNKLGPI